MSELTAPQFVNKSRHKQLLAVLDKISPAHGVEPADWNGMSSGEQFYELYRAMQPMGANPPNLRRFFDQLNDTGPIRIGCIGDSLGYRKLDQVNPELARVYSPNGGAVHGGVQLYGTVGSGAAADQSYLPYYWGTVYTIPTGGNVLFTGPGLVGEPGYGVEADTIKVYYIKDADSGTLKVQTSLEGAAFADEAGHTSVDCTSEDPGLGIITITKTRGRWRVKVVGVSGDCTILGAALYDSNSHGTTLSYLIQGGITLSSIVGSDLAIVQPLLEDLNLDLVLFEMDETDSTAAPNFTAENLEVLEGWIAEYMPDCDVIYVGSTPRSAGDGTNGDQDAVKRSQNSLLRTHAINHSRFYFDGYSPLGSYAAMVALGWEGDGVHPSEASQRYLSHLLLSQLGLFHFSPGVGMTLSTTGFSVGTNSPDFAIEARSFTSKFPTRTSMGVQSQDGSRFFGLIGPTNGGTICDLVRSNGTTLRIFAQNTLADGGYIGAVTLDSSGNLDAAGYLAGGTAGVNGSFTTANGKTVTVTKGLITSIV